MRSQRDSGLGFCPDCSALVRAGDGKALNPRLYAECQQAIAAEPKYKGCDNIKRVRDDRRALAKLAPKSEMHEDALRMLSKGDVHAASGRRRTGQWTGETRE